MERAWLNDETPIMAWSNFTLTSWRVWWEHREGSTHTLRSMPIDAVQAVALERRRYPLFLLLALLFAAGGIAFGGAVVAGSMALVSLVLFFGLRGVVVEIHAGNARLSQRFEGFRADAKGALQFLDAVEAQALAVRRGTPQLARARSALLHT